MQSMQKIRKPESNLTRKWWYMGHKAIPKLEKSDTKDEDTCKYIMKVIFGTLKLSSQQRRVYQLNISFNVHKGGCRAIRGGHSTHLC